MERPGTRLPCPLLKVKISLFFGDFLTLFMKKYTRQDLSLPNTIEYTFKSII